MKSIVVLLALVAFVSGSRAETGSPLSERQEGSSPAGSADELALTTERGRLAAKEEEEESIDELLPRRESLFAESALDLEGLGQLDCHLRNVDYCFAGLLGSMKNPLPENEQELEVRCDELKATTSCLAVYNQRCASFKLLSAMGNLDRMTFAPSDRLQELSPELASVKLPVELTELIMNKNGSQVEQLKSLRAVDLLQLCEPKFKNEQINQLLRRRIFELAKCTNSKVYQLNPCINDLKVALQIFYEPRRALPVKPSCCAIGRFRECARGALEGICGLSSWEQLEGALTSSSLGSGALKMVNRVCRQEASKFDSAYCLEVLPPVGLKGPPARRGSKASKLAKALELISLSQPPAPGSLEI